MIDLEKAASEVAERIKGMKEEKVEVVLEMALRIAYGHGFSDGEALGREHTEASVALKSFWGGRF